MELFGTQRFELFLLKVFFFRPSFAINSKTLKSNLFCTTKASEKFFLARKQAVVGFFFSTKKGKEKSLLKFCQQLNPLASCSNVYGTEKSGHSSVLCCPFNVCVRD
jgi:hypothetical protein